MILTPLLPYIVTFVAPIGLVTIQQTRTITAQPTESRVYKNDLKAHFFFPKGWKASDKRPAIVLFHGGGWTGGNPGTLYSQAAAAASRGMVGVSVQYRLAKPGMAPEEAVMDARSAMRYVRANAGVLGIDPIRIAAGGGSAGGHLAAHCGLVDALNDPADDKLVSCIPNALVLFNPVYANGPGEYGADRIGARFKEFSPADNIRSGSPPTLVMLGEKDALISVATAEKFRDAQKAVGIRSELTVYKGQAHGFYNREPYRQLTTSAMLTFIESIGWLRKTDPALLPILETPGLPRVLVIGDSISMGYTLPLRKLFDGKANVVHPPVNCSSTSFGLKELDSWLGAKPWDVIHVNFGLHDLKYLNAEGQLVSPEKGTLIADPAIYEANLRLLVQRLKATKAKVVWGQTTPVPSGATGRVAGSDTVYNAVARKVMTELDIPINDLHAVITSAPTGLQQPRNVHFTPAGYDALAAAVQKVVLPLLPVGR